jgi:tRNA1(Val) A37 N6-methylase TrmN6
MQCGCGCAFTGDANRQFNPAKVAGELKRYRENGPGVTTRLLIEGIVQSNSLGRSVLDIGAGFGSLAFALLERGASSAVAVDASSAYVEAAQREAAYQGRTGAIRFVLGDFVDVAAGLPPASTVTLDRVVCCYPAFEQLLTAALAHTERCLALSYPRSTWYVRAAMAMENGQRRLTGNPFRTFVHPVTLIENLITRAGLRLSSRRKTWVWTADVYVRP